MSKKRRIIFRADGNSRTGLGQLFHTSSHSAEIQLREAAADDLLLFYKWANDPEVRRHSFNPDPISIEDHTRWFQSKLKNINSKIYIAEVDGAPAAQIRFDIAEGTATISYLIGIEFRGKGFGYIVLQKGVEKLLEQRPDVHLVEGLVQQDNIASIRSFEKVGFNYGKADAKHPRAHRFILELSAKA